LAGISPELSIEEVLLLQWFYIEEVYGEGYSALTISFDAHDEWRKYCIDVFEKAGYHPVLAEDQWSLINIAYGLKIKEDDRETD
jgi:hypothetical protein